MAECHCVVGKIEKFWKIVGGRKQINGYLYAILLTVWAYRVDVSFEAYAMWLAGALLGTSVIVAAEDMKKKGTPSKQ